MTDSTPVCPRPDDIAVAVVHRLLPALKETIEVAAAPKLLVRRPVARAILGGISDVTFWRLEQRGVLRAHPSVRIKLYSTAALKKFAEEGCAERAEEASNYE